MKRILVSLAWIFASITLITTSFFAIDFGGMVNKLQKEVEKTTVQPASPTQPQQTLQPQQPQQAQQAEANPAASSASANVIPKEFYGTWTSSKCGNNYEAQQISIDRKGYGGMTAGTCDLSKLSSSSNNVLNQPNE